MDKESGWMLRVWFPRPLLGKSTLLPNFTGGSLKTFILSRHFDLQGNISPCCSPVMFYAIVSQCYKSCKELHTEVSTRSFPVSLFLTVVLFCPSGSLCVLLLSSFFHTIYRGAQPVPLLSWRADSSMCWHDNTPMAQQLTQTALFILQSVSFAFIRLKLNILIFRILLSNIIHFQNMFLSLIPFSCSKSQLDKIWNPAIAYFSQPTCSYSNLHFTLV